MLQMSERSRRCVQYGGLTLAVALCLGFGAYASFYRMTTPERVREALQQSLGDSGWQLGFDGNHIRRSLFPRPTLVLRRLTLGAPDEVQPAVFVEEAGIGLAWQSVFGQAEVEKLVLNGADVKLVRQESGSWNIDSLLEAVQDGGSAPKRILVSDSTVRVQHHNQSWRLRNVALNLAAPDKGIRRYEWSADVQHDDLPDVSLSANGQGSVSWLQQQWQLPDAQVQFRGRENGYDYSGSLNTAMRWENGVFHAEKSELSLQSKRADANVNVRAAALLNDGSRVQLNGINAVFSGSDAQSRQYNGTASSNQIQWQYQHLGSEEVAVNLNVKSLKSDDMNANFNGRVYWSRADGWQLPNVKLLTMQDNRLGAPRFVSEWEARWFYRNSKDWHFQAKGLFDRQPAELQLNADEAQIKGSLKLAKLNLAPYLDGSWGGEGTGYPSWLKTRRADIDISINTLDLPTLQINRLHSRLRAEKQVLQFAPLRAELYGGHSRGSLRVEWGEPWRVHLQQNADNVQVQPVMQDLFRSGLFKGRGQLALDLQTEGKSRAEWMQHLNGSFKVNIANGSWVGVNVRELVNPTPLGAADGRVRETPFSRFALNSKIQQGISRHTLSARFSDPVLNMDGTGETNLANGELKEDIVLYSDNRQTVLPLRLSGLIDNPSASLNYQQITQGLDTPEQKQQALSDTLKNQWKWLLDQQKQ